MSDWIDSAIRSGNAYFWLVGVAGLAFALCFSGIRRLCRQPGSFALLLSPVVIWALQLILIQATPRPLEGHRAALWIRLLGLGLFVLWPLLSGMLIARAKNARSVAWAYVAANLLDWLFNSFSSWVWLNGVYTL